MTTAAAPSALVHAAVDRLHGGVFRRRVRVLADAVAPLLPPRARALDVGCGDGALALAVMARRPDVAVTGIDVLVRPGTHVPVQAFDGRHIPADTGSVDAVLFVDVLHHAADPAALLREAARVSRGVVIIKDHLADRPLAEPTLRLMDWVGNARHGVRLPYAYWRRAAWGAAFAAAGLRPLAWEEDVPLYPAPLAPLFGRGLHFVAALGCA